MPSRSRALRRVLACIVLTAFTLAALLVTPRPAAAGGISGRTWTIITAVVIACFYFHGTPCHPLGLVTGATPPERTTACAGADGERIVALSRSVEEFAPVHTFSALGPLARCSARAPASVPPQSGRTGNEDSPLASASAT